MLPRPHLSVSQINAYRRCSYQYYCRYIEGIETPPSAAMTRGIAIHEGIAFNFRQKMESGLDLPLGQVLEYTATQFEDKAMETDFGDEDKSKIKDDTLVLAKLYHEHTAPKIQPLAVEERVEVNFEGADYSLLGFIDVIDQDRIIRDTKTTSRTPNEGVLRDNLQLIGYSMMYRTLTGEHEAGVALDYLVNNKTPKVVSFKTEVTQSQINYFLKTMDGVARAIKAGVFLPNRDNNFLCSPKYCRYFEKCQKEWS